MNNEILNLVGRRLIKGEKKYGHENVTSNGRDFVEEALEEALDLAVYVAAKLIEIKQKENTMGRAIDMENHLNRLEVRLKLVEDALEEMIQTKVHHIDLTDTKDVKIKGVKIEPEVVKHEKTTRKRAEATT
tara:strand:- start:278 stop:670 length:393 start_codon:yes stop_codon:yes gene_type:complete